MTLRQVLNRYGRYILFLGLTVLVLGALYIWRTNLLPFVVGLVMAYLFMPIIRWIERVLPGKGRWMEAKRVLAIALVFISIMGVFAAAAFITVTIIIHNSADLIQNASKFITNFIAKGQEWTDSIRQAFPPGMRATVDKVVLDAGNSIGNALTGSLKGGGTALTSSLGLILGFAALPLFLFYLLKDCEMIQNNVYMCLPSGVGKHARSVVNIIECTLGRYIKAELLLGAIVGSMSLVGLLIIQVPFALPLAFFNGICEMIPTVGPIIGGIVMSIVTLALAPDKVIWVVLLAIIIQLSENNLIAPRVTASCLHLHPALVIMLLVLGGYFWGFWGLVLTVPVTSTLVDIFNYVRSAAHEEGVKPGLAPQSEPADPGQG